MNKLTELRNQIDEVDSQIIRLIANRLKIAQKIGEYKQTINLPSLDQKRWDKITARRVSIAQKYYIKPKLINDIFNIIHNYILQTRKNNNE